MEALVILFCLVGATVVNSKSLDMPPYFTACAYDDPDLNACAVMSANKGYATFVKGDKKYRVPVLDPLEITSFQVNEGVLGLKMSARNLKVYGLKDGHVDSAEIDLKRNTARYNISIPRLEIEMEYEVNGKILILPISGTGPGNLTITNLKVSYTCEWDLVKKKDGKEYALLKDGQIDYTLSKLYIHLDNLFNGNNLLGDQMNVFMNENWRDLVRDIAPVITEAISDIPKRILYNIFESVSYDKAYPRSA